MTVDRYEFAGSLRMLSGSYSGHGVINIERLTVQDDKCFLGSDCAERLAGLIFVQGIEAYASSGGDVAFARRDLADVLGILKSHAARSSNSDELAASVKFVNTIDAIALEYGVRPTSDIELSRKTAVVCWGVEGWKPVVEKLSCLDDVTPFSAPIGPPNLHFGVPRP